MKTFIVFLTFLFPAVGLALDSSHCPFSCPSGAASSNYHVVRNVYTLSNNSTTKFADWVAYRVSSSTIASGRSRNWKADPDIWASRTLEPSDYTSAFATIGTDRGHQAPLASLGAIGDWQALNYLSNITPQRSELNQGPWNVLEGRVRSLAQRSNISSVYVVTGPLYEYNFGSLPEANESHRIPSAYWKVIYTDNGSKQTAAFIMDQSTPRSADMCNYVVTIDEVERRAGLNIHPQMPNQSSVERYLGNLRDDLGC